LARLAAGGLLALGLAAAEPARAFELFGFTLFGSDENTADVADPLRYTRLNVWDTSVCGVAAWAAQFIWAFWQPWGIMTFITMALAVQMSSRWMTTAERKV
jgi:hypothetical protein